jgi:DNA-binding MarR family transcriptional regulator
VSAFFRYAEMGYLEVWHDRIDERAVLDGLTPKSRRIALDVLDKVRHIRPLEKLTKPVDGKHLFIEHPPLIERVARSASVTPTRVFLDRLLQAYIDSLTYDRKWLLSRYQLVDFAHKVAGVGSVGTRCWVLLLQGADQNDPLFL